MNQDFEKRFLTSMLIMVLFLGFYVYIFNQAAKKTPPKTSSATETNSLALESTQPAPVTIVSSPSPSTNISLATKTLFLDIASEGAGVTSLSIDGKWNQSSHPVRLLQPVSLGYGVIQWDKESFASFKPLQSTETSSEWTTKLLWNNTPLEIRVRYDVVGDYTFVQTITVSNQTKEAVKLDYQGKSFSLRWRPDLMDTNTSGTGNIQTYGVYANKKFSPVLKKGLFSPAQNSLFVSNFQWLSVADNYFAFIVETLSPGITASYEVESRHKTVEKTAISLYLPIIFLGGGESTNFRIQYTASPKKESFLRAVNPAYGRLFQWPALFAWFMKPIEWAMVWLLNTLGGWITNKGIVIILIALIVKLLLSPLSIQAAISVKKQQLLQPKLKNIQEKYKDNQQLLQQKTLELYKKEKINPLGGCFPLLLQIPVFFALYRVLSQSVELKGATFLWIRDLTQTDTLFTMNIPFLPHNFNLLPLIMTAIQLIQTKLQTAKNPAMQGQSLNMYLLPLIFLFLFWNMPSGLVLYWTIQNIYTIIEQEIINLDRHIKL
ncbi:YidC/Oxa1 family insertase periplasmic-domain containing protein [Thermospira aquatica]|uniref:Membrane protein insertase YidC n=1 Tax=Thermospira aquatica TaxID=2828656 RepID=A0AAX3BE96_9SPIR|nr:YidC/Oxa1 family insertase periplasmic-domain containing protein [Thermospira aquatica]URA10677.1 YidC/Oxa1 family insertase periplasmic-domain containing protein [Thermospira aquatica]